MCQSLFWEVSCPVQSGLGAEREKSMFSQKSFLEILTFKNLAKFQRFKNWPKVGGVSEEQQKAFL